MRKFFLLGAIVVLASSFSATAQADTGLGFLYTDAPVGVFFDLDGQYIHVGVGFDKNDVPEGSGAVETEFTVAGAWMKDMWENGDSGFGPSVGVMFNSRSPEGDGDGDSMTHISVGLRGHWNPVSSFSFWVGHGLAIDLYSPPVGDSTTDFSLTGANVTDMGFTWWLP
ncbi:MAG: hypothetical protein DHS20C21_10920 [Gemmatimonadota bacterium]|nr:MAG: hypothetical protein DHS20C21_10920 [Gemmatimonadota bacterium]